MNALVVDRDEYGWGPFYWELNIVCWSTSSESSSLVAGARELHEP